jgi:hypothetical protein
MLLFLSSIAMVVFSSAMFFAEQTDDGCRRPEQSKACHPLVFTNQSLPCCEVNPFLRSDHLDHHHYRYHHFHQYQYHHLYHVYQYRDHENKHACIHVHTFQYHVSRGMSKIRIQMMMMIYHIYIYIIYFSVHVFLPFVIYRM